MKVQFSLEGEIKINVSPYGNVMPSMPIPAAWHQAVVQAAPAGSRLTCNEPSRLWSLSVIMTDKERQLRLDKYEAACRAKFNRALAALNAALSAIEDGSLPTVPAVWTSVLAINSAGSTFGSKD